MISNRVDRYATVSSNFDIAFILRQRMLQRRFNGPLLVLIGAAQTVARLYQISLHVPGG
jgi:hypothetical protein